MSGERPISVLIVDDSAVMRNLIGKIVGAAEGLVVAGKALNGSFALQKIPSLQPDVIILDLEMPDMNGIEFLRERRRRGIDIPVVILSSRAERGAQITMEALALGASDFIMKPTGSSADEIFTIAETIVQLVRGCGRIYQQQRALEGHRPPPGEESKPPIAEPTTAGGERVSAPPAVSEPRAEPARAAEPLTARPQLAGELGLPNRLSRLSTGPVEVVAIGISTGGPNALREVFAHIDVDLGVPIVVVQHMPPGFTAEFARSLGKICPLAVKEAEEGDVIAPGRVLVAPGANHIRVERRKLASTIALGDDGPVNGHRPSVDVLFESVARAYGSSALAVIMTGMGRDGAREIGAVHRAGGITVAQDEQSCVVFGMPKAAIESNVIQHVVPLRDMADAINWLVRSNRG